MKVILKTDVKGSGKAGDLIDVSDGYARNKLIPSGQAILATNENIKKLEAEKRLLQQKLDEQYKQAKSIYDKLNGVEFHLNTNIGSNGKLFGAVTAMDIKQEIQKQLDLDIDKKSIIIEHPIKEIGEHTIRVKLHTNLTAEFLLLVEG